MLFSNNPIGKGEMDLGTTSLADQDNNRRMFPTTAESPDQQYPLFEDDVNETGDLSQFTVNEPVEHDLNRETLVDSESDYEGRRRSNSYSSSVGTSTTYSVFQPSVTIRNPQQSTTEVGNFDSTEGTTAVCDPDQANWNDRRSVVLRLLRPRLHVTFVAMTLTLASTALLIFLINGAVLDSSDVLPIATVDISEMFPTKLFDGSIIHLDSPGMSDYATIGLLGSNDWSRATGFMKGDIPSIHYWFNPVTFLRDRLLKGSDDSLLEPIYEVVGPALYILKHLFRLMVWCILAGTIGQFVIFVMTPFAVFSRWLSLPLGVLSWLSMLCSLVGAATITIFAYCLEMLASSKAEANIHVHPGIPFIAVVWASVFIQIIICAMQSVLGCVTSSRRDIKKGRVPRGATKMGIELGILPKPPLTYPGRS